VELARRNRVQNRRGDITITMRINVRERERETENMKRSSKDKEIQ